MSPPSGVVEPDGPPAALTEYDAPIDAPAEAEEPVDDIWGEKPKRRRRKARKMPGEDIAYLNLTPMMDIMTMLLVFLVKSFAVEPENINVNLKLRPPPSTTTIVLDAATKVTITSEQILVDDLPVIDVEEIKVNPKTGMMDVPGLHDALLERVDHLKALSDMGGTPFDGRLLVVAHETTPYLLLTSLLEVAGDTQFSQFKLVVMQKTEKKP